MKNKQILKLANIFKENDSTLYVVGGFVRDEILKIKTNDIDVAGDISPQKVKKICLSKFNVSDASKKLGTLIIENEEFKCKYTPFRSEEYLSGADHSPYKIKFEKELQTDAYRRDFTVNAIYKDVLTDKIIDPYGGVKDIKHKLIKQIHKNVFDVDPLRILRMVRFASKYNFKIELKTFNLAKKNAYKIKFLSKDRISEEVNKIILNNNATVGIELLQKLSIIPTAKLNYFKYNNSLLCLCADIFKKDEKGLKEFLSIYSKNKKQEKEIMDTIQFANEFDSYRNIQTFIGKENLLFGASSIVDDTIQFGKLLDVVIKRKLPLSINQLNIDGNDLKEIGVKEKEIGKMLKILLIEVVRDGLDNKKDLLIKKVKEIIK